MEVLIVVGIVGILTGIAYPRVDELARRSRFDGASRRMVGALRESRAMAIARQSFAGSRAAAVGVRIDSATQYTQIYDVDTDAANNNDRAIRVADNASAAGFRITSPAPGTVIRFARDGSTTARSIVLTDSLSSLTRTIRLTSGGQTSME